MGGPFGTSKPDGEAITPRTANDLCIRKFGTKFIATFFYAPSNTSADKYMAFEAAADLLKNSVTVLNVNGGLGIASSFIASQGPAVTMLVQSPSEMRDFLLGVMPSVNVETIQAKDLLIALRKMVHQKSASFDAVYVPTDGNLRHVLTSVPDVPEKLSESVPFARSTGTSEVR